MTTIGCGTTIRLGTDPSIYTLGTRHTAVPFRQQVESALEEKGRDICLDFSGVTVTQGFMDALLGMLILRYGPAVLERLAFKACSDDVRAVINFVASTRTRDYTELASKAN